MAGFDPEKVKFAPRRLEPSVFQDYLEQVANGPGLLSYKDIFQHGGKRGESLSTHILNGVLLLEALRAPLHLSDLDLRLLFTVFTIHDINKDPDFTGQSYVKIAIPANFERQIQKLGLDDFFPDYALYLADVTHLASQHGGHSGVRSFTAVPSDRLSRPRLDKLLSLIRAADVVDLSHTLEERSHKATFLSYLNDFADERQYTFFIHRLAENRGTLTNMIHEAIVGVLQEEQLIPLLYYPDGVAYLMVRDSTKVVDDRLRRKMARRVAAAIDALTEREFASFIKSGIAGVKVDPKCLELGIPFEDIWATIHTRVQTRNLDRETLLEKVRERTERSFEKNAVTYPAGAAFVRQMLEQTESLLPISTDRLRDGELVRTYYIFLNTHLRKEIPDAWEHIYDLFDIPIETREWLNFFDARWDRPYVFINEIDHSHEAIYETIEVDGKKLLEAHEIHDDKVDLFDHYLARYALFGLVGRVVASGAGDFADHLSEYVTSQHRQCVYCSTLYPTDRWMTNDVRSDITVQTYSNRLRGGPGEPKKYICRLCQLQFLVEKLNFEEIRGEKTMYLHFFPYSFLPAPFLTAMRDEINRIRESDTAVRALWCDTRSALLYESKGIDPDFATKTRQGKPHPFGIYMPRVPRHTVGNRLIFPINPAGENDSQRFLFALWTAMVLQKHLGLRVMLTEAPVAPLHPETELYIDNVALSCRGLVEHNEYGWYADYHQASDGRLPALWEQARAIHHIADSVRTLSKRDETLALVQAMSRGPLHVYYTTEKLLEARAQADQKSSSSEWLEIRLSQRIFPHLVTLTHSKGGRYMAELSQHLQRLAEIAWKGRLRGKSLKKNSLMMPLDETFQKLNQRSQVFDDEALKAVIAEEIFEYLERIAEEQYAPGRKKMAAAVEFVETFFNDVYQGSYQGNRTRLLADEKLLRSAFMFFIRQQIGSKRAETEEAEQAAEA